MILMSSFVSNRVACSVIQRLHKEKPTVSENLRPNAVTALLSDFHLAGVGWTGSLHRPDAQVNRTDWRFRYTDVSEDRPPTSALMHLCSINDPPISKCQLCLQRTLQGVCSGHTYDVSIFLSSLLLQVNKPETSRAERVANCIISMTLEVINVFRSASNIRISQYPVTKSLYYIMLYYIVLYYDENTRIL